MDPNSIFRLRFATYITEYYSILYTYSVIFKEYFSFYNWPAGNASYALCCSSIT